MALIIDRISRRWEMHHPLIAASCVTGAALATGPKIFEFASNHDWKIDQLYTCIFTLDTVFTAFLFTFYTFVVTPEKGFLHESRRSRYFKLTIRYTLGAIALGSLLSIATIPLLVIQPAPRTVDPWLCYAAGWAGLTTWVVAAFIRATYLFSIFARHQA